MGLRRAFGLLLVTGFVAAWADGSISLQTLQVTPGITLAGSLAPDAQGHLATSNTLVVDLRGTGEGADDEARAMALVGVDYVHLPMGVAAPEPADVNFLSDLLEVNEHRPVVIHCRSGNRAALLWGAYRLQEGGALPDVLEEVAPIATSPVISQSIAQFAESQVAKESR
jgi:uncharacterized protein (TIGR01244 family)